MADQDGSTQAEGLLEKIAETALDDDYYVVRAGDRQPSRKFNTMLTGVVLAVFALLVTIAAVQTRNDRPATERERKTLISDVAARKKGLAAREATATRLREQVADLASSVAGFDPDYETLRVQTADRAAIGPGITISASPRFRDDEDGRITDYDLRVLVNGLWYAGAEAIAINGQRIGTLTSIHFAGSGMLINFKPVGPPYTIVALGDDQALGQRFADNPAGRYWASRRKNAGVQSTVTPSSELAVPAAPRVRVKLTHAHAIKGDQ